MKYLHTQVQEFTSMTVMRSNEKDRNRSHILRVIFMNSWSRYAPCGWWMRKGVPGMREPCGSAGIRPHPCPGIHEHDSYQERWIEKAYAWYFEGHFRGIAVHVTHREAMGGGRVGGLGRGQYRPTSWGGESALWRGAEWSGAERHMGPWTNEY